MIEEPSLLALYGRFHPLVLHFPIALLFAAAAFEAVALVRRRPAGFGAGGALLIAGAASAVLAASMGFVLSLSGGYGGETFNAHRFWGFTVAGLAVLALVLKFGVQSGVRLLAPAYGGALSASIVAIFIAGHHGGAMTHGADFLPSAAPQPIARLLGGEAHTVSVSVSSDHYSSEVEPILAEHCFSCHGDSRQRGGLRLDIAAEALAGGESGSPSIVPGDVQQSQLVRRIFLPRSDDKAMPPGDRARPSAEELVILVDWIAAGAPWAGEFVGPTPIPADLLGEDVEPADPELVAALENLGARVRALSVDNPLLSVDLALVDAAPDAIVPALEDVKEHVAWLALGGGEGADAVATAVSEFPHLTRFDASRSSLTDGGLQALAAAPELRWLNAAQSGVTAAGVRALADATALQSLFLWNTAVTDDDVAALRAEHASVEIHHAATLAIPEATEVADG